MAKIVPAILEKSFDEIENKLSEVRGFVKSVQIDVCDGGFVPNNTWPYTASTKDRDFENIVNQEVGMPYWEEFDFEYDLMVRNPYAKIADFISAGASKIIVHLDSADDEELSKIVKDYGKSSEDMSLFNINIGLAIRSTSDKKRLEKFIKDVSFVQVMGIKRIGFQGEPFDEDSLETIKSLRGEYGKLIISVDGGVNENTAKLFLDAGADILVVGSGIFNAENPAEKLREFEAL